MAKTDDYLGRLAHEYSIAVLAAQVADMVGAGALAYRGSVVVKGDSEIACQELVGLVGDAAAALGAETMGGGVAADGYGGGYRARVLIIPGDKR